MMPGNVLSSEPMPSTFLPPDDRAFDLHRDFEYGGIAHQDPSQGLMYQVWTCWVVESGAIQIQPENGSQPAILVATVPGAEYISLAFDRNMNVAVAWVVGGVASLRWFDSTVEEFVTTEYPGISCPRLTHDDKREGAGSWSDVIFAYLRDGRLCTRQQRDRYEIEYQHEEVQRDLIKLGMATGLRLQFEV